MKTIKIYYDNRTGEVIVEHEPTLNMFEIMDVLHTSTRIVYEKIMDTEARRRQIEASQLEELIKLISKQKDPRMN